MTKFNCTGMRFSIIRNIQSNFLSFTVLETVEPQPRVLGLPLSSKKKIGKYYFLGEAKTSCSGQSCWALALSEKEIALVTNRLKQILTWHCLRHGNVNPNGNIKIHIIFAKPFQLTVAKHSAGE